MKEGEGKVGRGRDKEWKNKIRYEGSKHKPAKGKTEEIKNRQQRNIVTGEKAVKKVRNEGERWRGKYKEQERERSENSMYSHKIKVRKGKICANRKDKNKSVNIPISKA